MRTLFELVKLMVHVYQLWHQVFLFWGELWYHVLMHLTIMCIYIDTPSLFCP